MFVANCKCVCEGGQVMLSIFSMRLEMPLIYFFYTKFTTSLVYFYLSSFTKS
jgi:hypothetical protein